MPDKKPLNKMAIIAFLALLLGIVLGVVINWQFIIYGIGIFLAIAVIEAGSKK